MTTPIKQKTLIEPTLNTGTSKRPDESRPIPIPIATLSTARSEDRQKVYHSISSPESSRYTGPDYYFKGNRFEAEDYMQRALAVYVGSFESERSSITYKSIYIESDRSISVGSEDWEFVKDPKTI
jgi:hypothetical protein